MTNQPGLFDDNPRPTKGRPITAAQAREMERQARENRKPAGYYNTTNLVTEELEKARQSTDEQQAAIERYFYDHRDRDLTPWEVAEHFKHWPITSIRRAITNLQKAGRLIKTRNQRKGPYGRPSYAWQYAKR